MAFERSIKYAIIEETGEIIDADDYFSDKKKSDEIRTEYNRGKITFLCLECAQKLSLSKSNRRIFYLKHFSKSQYCELKEESLSSKEQEAFSQILIAKESPRHIFLKNRIGELLKETIDVSDVKIDDYFIFNKSGKRRKPDVFCKYLDKEIVFEIQLSKLSQKYILGRHDFYKEKGIYLIWVLDNFDVEGDTTTELDIKYLSQHQNYFRFKDASNFQLNCKFKQTHLNTENNFYDKWNEVDITLDKLQFDGENYEVYFYNFLKNKDELKVIQKKNQEIIDKEREEKRLKKEESRIGMKIYSFFQTIAEEKEKHISNFHYLKEELKELDEKELQAMNNSLAIDDKERLFSWLKNANDYDWEFFDFILSSPQIEKNINKKDKEGYGIFNYLMNNKSIYYKEKYLKLFFKNGLKFLEENEQLLKLYYNNIDEQQRVILIYHLANYSPKWEIDLLFEYKTQRVLCIVESILQKKIIGFKFKSWIALMNYAIHNYSSYWSYIELALRATNLFEEIILLDKKKTFQKKLENHKNEKIEYDKDFDYLYNHLYSELIYNE